MQHQLNVVLMSYLSHDNTTQPIVESEDMACFLTVI